MVLTFHHIFSAAMSKVEKNTVCLTCKERIDCPRSQQQTSCERCKHVSDMLKSWEKMPEAPYWTVVFSLTVGMRHLGQDEGAAYQRLVKTTNGSAEALLKMVKATDIVIRQLGYSLLASIDVM